MSRVLLFPVALLLVAGCSSPQAVTPATSATSLPTSSTAATLPVSTSPPAGTTPDATPPPPTMECKPSPTKADTTHAFVDGQVLRDDIRGDASPSGASTNLQPGAPLRLIVSVSVVSNGVCAPAVGARLDVWHANAEGNYSGSQSAENASWLRGAQDLSSGGSASFTTIYPGWTSGRAVHVHAKVRTNTSEFATELYFPDVATRHVATEEPYATRGEPDTSNAQDALFVASGGANVLDLTPQGESYVGAIHLVFVEG